MFLALSLLALAAPAPQALPRPTHGFAVPEGLEARVFAATPLLRNPTAMDVDARGRVWVTEAVDYRRWGGRNEGYENEEPGDRVVILEDTDGDGVADTSKVFAQDADLVSPLGIAVVGNRVFVSNSPHLFVYFDDDGDDVADRRETFLTGFGGPNHDHGLHSLVVGPDGKYYLSVGNAGPHIVTDASGWTLRSGSLYTGGGEFTADNKPGLVSDDGEAWTGGLVLRVNPDGTGLEVLAHNFRNNYEVALDSYGNLFVGDNDDDGNQGCRWVHALEAGNHGYFSADGKRYWSADRRPGQTTQDAHWHQADPGVAPMGTITGAGGPTGTAVYEGRLLGPWLEGHVLGADAGAGVVYDFAPSVAGGRIELEPGVLISAVAPDPGASASDEDAGPQSDDGFARWFRPSDVCVAPDGSVFVADWFDPGVGGHWMGDAACYGRIVRIAPAGAASARYAPPPVDLTTLDGRLAALASPAPNVRGAARLAIAEAETGGPTDTGAGATLDPNTTARERMRLVWAGVAPELLAKLPPPEGDEADLTEAALRRALSPPPTDLEAFRARWRGGIDTQLTLVAALGELRRLRAEEDAVLDVFQLLQLWDGEDRTALEAIGLAAEGLEENLYLSLAPRFGDTPQRWTEFFELLAWRLHPVAAVPGWRARAGDPTLSREARRRAVDALGFTQDPSAADALLDLTLAGPDDVRPYSRWWIEYRDSNDWREWNVADELGPDGYEAAELVWSSAPVTSGSPPLEFDIDVRGAESLWLVVDESDNGKACDWADWLELELLPETESDALPPLALAETDWLDATTGWGSVRRGANCEGGPLSVGGEVYESGIGTHADSAIGFAVPAGYVRLRGLAALDDGGSSQPNSPAKVEFRVYAERPPNTAWITELEALVTSSDTPGPDRKSALLALARDRDGGAVLIKLAQREALAPEQLELAARDLFSNPDPVIRALASEHFPRPDGADLPPVSELLALDGDPRRGREVFFSQKAQCSTCHTLERQGELALYARGGDVGPALTSIRSKYGRDGLLDAILNPSAGIAHGYDTWIIEDAEGRTYTGFLLADGEDVVLKDTQGKRHVIAAADIVDRWRQNLSAMPEGLALGIEPQELADLLAFLEEDPDVEPTLGEEQVLFDGTSLHGWTYYLTDPDAEASDVWSIEDGILVCKGNPIGYLRTEADYEDFELTLQWRFDPAKGAGNSGVLLRLVGEDKVWPKSIEAQLHSGNAGDIWNIESVDLSADPARTQGRRTVRLAPASEKPLGEWNHYRIRMNGGSLRLWVNDVLQNEAEWCARVPGKIALQSEGAEIHFRDVRLRPILR